MAIARTLLAWGLEPAAVIGHSMGEVAAAHIAQALSLEDAADVVCERSRLLAEISGHGGLALVELSGDEAARMVAGREHELSVAAVNGPRATVLAGIEPVLDAAIDALAGRGLFAKRVAVEFAAHSPQVEPLRLRLRAALAGLTPRDEAVALYSTVTGGPIAGRELDADYWTRNMREPVLFGPALTELISDGCDAVLEIAPHPVLLRAIADTVREAGGELPVLSSMRRDNGELAGMLGVLGEYYTLGGRVNWAAVHGTDRVPHVDLPEHPWEHARFPVIRPWPTSGPGPRPADPGRLTGERIRVGIDPALTVWPLPLDDAAAPELADHLVSGIPVVPGAYWLTAVAEAAAQALDAGAVVIENARFDQPLPAEGAASAQVALRSDGTPSLAFTITSERPAPGFGVHATGSVRAATPADRPPDAPLAETSPLTAASPDALYAQLARAGLAYGERFRAVRELRREAGRATARVQAPIQLADAGRWPLHPALLDACLHTVGAALGDIDELRALPLPTGVNRVWAARAPVSTGRPGWQEGWCQAEITCEHRVGGHREITADVTVAGDTGAPVWKGTGLRVRLLATGRTVQDGRLYDLAWSPLADSARRPAPGTLLIIPGDSGLAAALAGALIRDGSGEVMVASDPAFPLAGADGSVASIVDLRAAGGSPPVAESVTEVTARALRLVTAIASRPWPDRVPDLWLVTATGDMPESAGLWGLGRTVANEHPEWACSVVDVETAADAGVLRSLLDRAEPPSQVEVRDGRPRVPSLRPVTALPALPALRDDREYLVTGAFGVLGRYVARWLADRGARHLLLIGRSAPAPDADQDIERLREQGVTVRVARADIGSRGELAAILRPCPDAPPRGGVFHLAGVLEDALVADLDEDGLRRSLAGKAVGAWHLHELTADDPIEQFVLFSSLAGLVGSPGQAAYAAGNTLIDALARYRTALGRPGLSIAWGPWADSGLAVTGGGVERLAARGVLPLRPDVGMELLDHALAAGLDNVVAAAFDPRALSQAVAGPAARQVLGSLMEQDSGTAGFVRGSTRDTILAATFAGERRQVVTGFLVDQIAAVLRAPVASVDRTVAFQDLGFDSLMAIELRDRLETAFDLRLSATLVYAHPTAEALAEELLRRIEPEPGSPEGTEPDTPPATGMPAPSADLPDLSLLDDDQMAALLAAELEGGKE